jgi:hypothetical protein
MVERSAAVNVSRARQHCADLEARLRMLPNIKVPTINLEGGSDGIRPVSLDEDLGRRRAGLRNVARSARNRESGAVALAGSALGLCVSIV